MTSKEFNENWASRLNRFVHDLLSSDRVGAKEWIKVLQYSESYPACQIIFETMIREPVLREAVRLADKHNMSVFAKVRLVNHVFRPTLRVV